MIPLSIVIDLEPNLFRIGSFLITWHGVFSVLGILAAARLGLWLLGKDGVDTRHGFDGVTWMVVVGLIGARLLYVWENFRLFSGQWLRIFALNEGGISQWGGLFGAAVGEHHGTPTNLPWGVEYVNPDTLGEPGKVVHPEVAYEMILTLALLGALLPLHRRLKARLPNGVLGLVYFGLYAAGRFFLSYFRTDPTIWFGLRQAQLASLAMVLIAVVAIPMLLRRARAPQPEEPAKAA